MNSGKALGAILMAACGGAIIGGVVGILLAILLPDYYASVFSGPVDALQTGLGLGISQGLIAGGMIGLGVVAILTWREVKLREIESRRNDNYPRPGR